MMSLVSAPARKHRWVSPTQILRDYAYVLPGFFISLIAFVVLVPLTALSIGTLIIWIGALLLPLTLSIASGFAQLSRIRLRTWGVELPSIPSSPKQPGLRGLLGRMAEPRRWLDLAFETLIAFPLRTLTFAVALTWTVGALAGITYVVWGSFIPRDDVPLPGIIIEALTNGAAPDALTHSFLLDVGFNFLAGCIFLVSLPFVMRGLAYLDAITTAAALGGQASTTVTAHNIGGADESAGHAHSGRTAARVDGAPRSPEVVASRSNSRDGWAWIVVAVVAIASIATNWPVLSALYEIPVAIAMVLALAYAAALFLVIHWPSVGIAVQTATTVATAFAAVNGAVNGADWPWPWPVVPLIVQSVIVMLVALRRPWPWALAAWILPQAAALLVSIPVGLSEHGMVSMIVSASVTLGIAVISVVIRQLVSSRGALQAERRANADLSAERRELDERTRIAQELHDVVAHSMSVISVQATTAQYRLPGLDTQVEREFDTIASSSRQALSEMRSLLSLLRSRDESEVQLAPQPTLSDIPALVDATRHSGAQISLQTIPEIDPNEQVSTVSAATGLTAYRIVQEALSNAVRHAPGSKVDVVLEITGGAGPDGTDGSDGSLDGDGDGDGDSNGDSNGSSVAQPRLEVSVSNGPAESSAGQVAAPGAGLGLAGLRERATAIGGSVESGPTESRGFLVRAVLPLS